jgi:hypothetical protein
MTRTTIMLPAELKASAMNLAVRQGISFGEVVRKALAAEVARVRVDGARDPLFADDLLQGVDSPTDLSSRHDDYLYEDPP